MIFESMRSYSLDRLSPTSYLIEIHSASGPYDNKVVANEILVNKKQTGPVDNGSLVFLIQFLFGFSTMISFYAIMSSLDFF